VILILTAADDAHANRVANELTRRGAPFVRFDPATFPASATLSMWTEGHAPEINFQMGAVAVGFPGVGAIWYRRPGVPCASERVLGPDTRTAVSQMAARALDDVWHCVRCSWVPARPDVLLAGGRKLFQLRTAMEVGLVVPPTLITNDPAAFIRFYRQHDGHLVSKRLPGSLLDAEGGDFCRYTEAVATRDIGYAQAVSLCPAIFQAEVPKRLEVRVTIVGDQVFAVEIDSQATNHTRGDWRRYDHLHTPYRVHTLPDQIEARCLALTKLLGLRFNTLDLILRPDGEYVFIEMNPNGQYLWTEIATRLPISDAVADLLVSADTEAPEWNHTTSPC
jgi:hypothetical protein